MKLDVFVYIPSKSVRDLVYTILAKKGWHWYGTSDPYGFDPDLPFYLYMIKEANVITGDGYHLSWSGNRYTNNGGYTEIGINELLEEDHGTDQT